MTCKECYHYEACGGFLPSDLDKDVWDLCAKGKSDEIPDIEDRCSEFKDKSLIVELPCKVGDTVYVHDNIVWTDECCHCEHFRIGGFGDPNECARTKSPFKHPDCIEISEIIATEKNIYSWLAYDEFDKTVFLTREAAEKALKR